MLYALDPCTPNQDLTTAISEGRLAIFVVELSLELHIVLYVAYLWQGSADDHTLRAKDKYKAIQ